METKPTRVAIYARISDDPEGREAGVARQIEDCQSLIESMGWSMSPYAPFVDNDISASTLSRTRRPAYEDMMQKVRDGELDGIVYYTNGRLTRRPREFEDIIELYHQTKVALKSVKSVSADLSTADGRFIARTLAAQDAAEAERISERVRRANEGRRKQNRPEPSSRAFGYEKGGEVINLKEAALIREAAERIISEGWSLGRVVKDWNDRKIPTLRGGKGWSRMQVSRALTSPRTAGLLSLKGEIVGEWEDGRILTPDQRLAILDRLKDNKAHNVVFTERKHVIAGFMVCGKCGTNMKVNVLRDEEGNIRKDSYIVCSRSQFGCGNVKRNYLHVWGYLDAVIRNRIEMFEPMGEVQADEDGPSAQVREIEAKLTEVREDIADLQADFEAGEIRYRDYQRSLAALRTREEGAENALGQAAKRGEIETEVDLLATWEDGSVEEKRAIFGHFVDHVKMHPIGRVGPFKALELVPTSTEVVFKS